MHVHVSSAVDIIRSWKMRCHFNAIGTCMHVCVNMCACVCASVCVHACVTCVCVIYGCHSCDDQSSYYCSRRSVNLSQGSPTDSSRHLRTISKQCIDSLLGSEWPEGVKESVKAIRNTVILAWYAVLANIIID